MNIKHIIDQLRYNVVLDGKDSSVTFNRRLFNRLGGFGMKDMMMVFKVGDRYAFTNEHGRSEKETALAKVQKNMQLKCIGFETLVPTVNRILFDYGLDANIKVRLCVEVHKVSGMHYYVIVPPKKGYEHRN